MVEQESKFKTFLYWVAGTFTALLAMSIVSAVLNPNNNSQSGSNGYVMSVGAFNSSCVPAAEKEGATHASSVSYCTCVYEAGVKKLGGERFSALGSDISSLTNEINNCIELTNAKDI